MGPVRLAKLVRVESIREVWPHERYDFSAWLLENSEYLAEVLAIELELERSEEPVGDFSLDLIGRDLTNGAALMVENQLETTDHSHLGQVLLYAAGTGAGTIVWIARQFRPEHRQALNWLNENTSEEFHFFGVEVGAVRIEDSPIAPLLTLVVQPSDWQKRVREQADANRLSGKGKLYVNFWNRFVERVQQEHPELTRRQAGSRPQNWLDMPSGIKGTGFAASFARGKRLRYELYIDGGNAERNLEVFNALRTKQAELDAAYGRPLTFEELPERSACRVADYYEDADVTDEDRHDEFIDWFFDSAERLRQALTTIDLDASG
jgi:hypothetical protein